MPFLRGQNQVPSAKKQLWSPIPTECEACFPLINTLIASRDRHHCSVLEVLRHIQPLNLLFELYACLMKARSSAWWQQTVFYPETLPNSGHFVCCLAWAFLGPAKWDLVKGTQSGTLGSQVMGCAVSSSFTFVVLYSQIRQVCLLAPCTGSLALLMTFSLNYQTLHGSIWPLKAFWIPIPCF